MFPDDKSFGTGESGIPLTFGDLKNIDESKIADPEDPHLAPGESFIFTIPEKMRKGLRDKHEKSPEILKKSQLEFSQISFGDGTGFVAEQPRDTVR